MLLHFGAKDLRRIHPDQVIDELRIKGMHKLTMDKLTTIELVYRGISANVIDIGIVECSVRCSFNKGHGGCRSWGSRSRISLRKNNVGNERWE